MCTNSIKNKIFQLAYHQIDFDWDIEQKRIETH